MQAIKNVWNDKTDPSLSVRSDWPRLVGSILSFGLLAPALIKYREEKVSTPWCSHLSSSCRIHNLFPSERQESKTGRKASLMQKKPLKLRFFWFRLKPNGINYSDPYPLEHPNRCNLPLPVNQYIHRMVNFHRAPRIKYFYRCVRTSRNECGTSLIGNPLTHFSSSTAFFSYSSRTYSYSSLPYHRMQYPRLIGQRSWCTLLSQACWSRNFSL